MFSRYHGHPPLGSDDPVGPVQRVLEHGPRPNEGAILLRFVAPEPLLNEAPERLSFAARQND